jgi:hypothetical protein
MLVPRALRAVPVIYPDDASRVVPLSNHSKHHLLSPPASSPVKQEKINDLLRQVPASHVQPQYYDMHTDNFLPSSPSRPRPRLRIIASSPPPQPPVPRSTTGTPRSPTPPPPLPPLPGGGTKTPSLLRKR